MESAMASSAALNKENTCPPAGQTQEKRSSVVVGSAKKKFPEGERYELLLMEIVDKNNAHIPPKNGISKCWEEVYWYSLLAEQFQESVANGTANEDEPSETMSRVYGIANDHALEEADAKDAEVAAKMMAEHDATKQVAEGRALRLKCASSIVAGEAIQVGGPMMVLGDNGEVVELGSEDDSAPAQVMVTPAANKINKRRNVDNSAVGASSNKALCRDLIDSLTKTRQGNAEIEVKRFDFEKQMAEKRFEKEKEDSQRQHEIQLCSMDLQKMQWEMQMAEMKIRMAELERGGRGKEDSSK
ncbi:hypothetical protein MHU86_4253 [Fragilaria crotonensis]|nr:hypothetical protein MHU86_4253 [Fragilaria crotonensis]